MTQTMRLYKFTFNRMPSIYNSANMPKISNPVKLNLPKLHTNAIDAPGLLADVIMAALTLILVSMPVEVAIAATIRITSNRQQLYAMPFELLAYHRHSFVFHLFPRSSLKLKLSVSSTASSMIFN